MRSTTARTHPVSRSSTIDGVQQIVYSTTIDTSICTICFLLESDVRVAWRFMTRVDGLALRRKLADSESNWALLVAFECRLRLQYDKC